MNYVVKDDGIYRTREDLGKDLYELVLPREVFIEAYVKYCCPTNYKVPLYVGNSPKVEPREIHYAKDTMCPSYHIDYSHHDTTTGDK